MKILRTDSSNVDFVKLVKLLDNDLKVSDGEDHEFYNQFNKIEGIKNAVVIFKNTKPVACGAFKPFDSKTVEIKRMYCEKSERGQGFATMVLNELEAWAQELGYRRSVLETGLKQTEALKLYPKNNYRIIPNYGQYIGIKNSVCFGKNL